MTPLKMFRKICDAKPCARLHHNSDDLFCIFKIDGNALTVPEPSPEAAIEAAYKKLFPPIPKEVGDWHWDSGEKAWFCVGAYVTYDADSNGERLYDFHAAHGGGNLAWTKENLKGFLKLIEINPELKPPTEEE